MFRQLAAHTYYFPCDHYSDRPNIGYIAGDRAALLFEAGSSARHAGELRAALNAGGLAMPAYVALSHWHWDHSFGLHFWNALTVAGAETNRELGRVAQWRWDAEAMKARVEKGEDIQFCHDMMLREYPRLSDIKVIKAELEFDGTVTLDLGGVHCVLMHVKGPHSSDSVICYVPEDDFVFLGDSNGKDLYGKPWHFDLAHEEELVPTLMSIPYDDEKLIPYRELLSTLSFSRCLGGHADVMSREELLDSLK